ncbi:hypothetical protein [Hansschlegelia zhihuaiae]|uniref:Uncharacterized protein n=1 Tax=Hansschlegelia zhihuaiae TaxID=405005 RepID=A0A4Q0MFM1_9HYPH|nr:hypothetical protein [Hansschlegelia zhihuaiae]RXF72095.1 hypothetical protein EK403_14900 [Hansschlegelia zhihuaiae]
MNPRPARRSCGDRGPEASRLAAALRERFPTHLALRDFGVTSGVGYTVAERALEGRPIAALDHLRICAALGLDPATLEPPSADAPRFGGAILWVTFGAALTVARHLKGHDQRTAAMEASVSLATVSRAEHGRALGAAIYLRLCAYAGKHPHFWTVTPERAEAVARLATSAPAPEPAAARDCFTGDMP